MARKFTTMHMFLKHSELTVRAVVANCKANLEIVVITKMRDRGAHRKPFLEVMLRCRGRVLIFNSI
jgi:hypothetical protein